MFSTYFSDKLGPGLRGMPGGRGWNSCLQLQDRSCPSLPKSEDTGTLLIQAARLAWHKPHLLSWEPEATGFSHLVSAVT